MTTSHPTAPEQLLGEDQAKPWLFYLFKRWYSAGQSRVEEVTRTLGMTTADYSSLSLIARKGPCSSADIARTSKVTPQAATQQVAQLEAKGLVIRYEKPSNRRITLIEVSDLGRKNLASIDERITQIEQEILASMSADQQSALRALLSQPPLLKT